MKKVKIGMVIIPDGADPWPHEKRVAKILAASGHCVEFIPESGMKTPDIYLDGVMYEIKSPVSDKVDAVERNIVRALVKCQNIVFDSSRMKVRDYRIIGELIRIRKAGKGVKKLIFVNKQREVIDIKGLI